MAGKNGRGDLQGVFGALLGGLISSFLGSIIFVSLTRSDGSSASWAVLVAVIVGLACAAAFMVAGLLIPERLRWLGSALLFASGFTTMWSVTLSFGVQPKWVVPTALGVAIVIGLTIGIRRFSSMSPDAPLAPEPKEAAWTH